MFRDRNRLRFLVGILKDNSSTLKIFLSAKRTTKLRLAILPATSHAAASPPSTRSLSTDLSLGGDGSRRTAATCIKSLIDRLHGSNNAYVSLKCLLTVHTIVSKGSFILRDQLSVYPASGGRNFLNLSRFRDRSNKETWELSGWVRWYAAVIEQNLAVSRSLGPFLSSSSSDGKVILEKLNRDLLKEIEIEILVDFVKLISESPRCLQSNDLVYEVVKSVGEDYRLVQWEILIRVGEFRDRMQNLFSFVVVVVVEEGIEALSEGKKRRWWSDNEGDGGGRGWSRIQIGEDEIEKRRKREKKHSNWEKMSRKVSEKEYQQVVVAVDKDKGSQNALKWATDHLLSRGHSIVLLHVKHRPSSVTSVEDDNNNRLPIDGQARELLLPFRCFCTRKDLKCSEVVVEDYDVAKAIADYVNANSVDVLVLGSPSRGGLVRKFRVTDVPSNVTKLVPDFCTVYIIGKGKISSVKSATASVPAPPKPGPAVQQHQMMLVSAPSSPAPNLSNSHEPASRPYHRGLICYQYHLILFSPNDVLFAHSSFFLPAERSAYSPRTQHEDDFIRSPFTRGRASIAKLAESPMPDSDISFVSSGRPSIEYQFSSLNDSDPGATPRLSTGSDFDVRSTGSSSYSGGNRSMDLGSFQNLSNGSYSSLNLEDMEAEMRKLRQELRQTMEMYSSACKEALNAKQQARELHRWRMEEEQRLEEARMSEEAALALVEKEKAKCKAALEAAEAAEKIAQFEAQKRRAAEMRAMQDSEDRKKAGGSLAQNDVRYRRYDIEEIEMATKEFANNLKIGEGGYGPVYKAYLDHTPVAIKVLRPDAAQGRSQFQQEVEVLSCIRHPNMVLLLGACPEYGCLVYEYMANGSLEDRLLRRGNTPTLSWQVRFRISAEIATALLFLHQTKPEPLVHRDLKPGNILLDRNFVSKISDVGLARLVPPSVADSVTQYRMTSTAGTFCYIDPEYQQTGMLGVKSDIYSLGIMLLQIITAKPPMGLTHHVQKSIEKGTFAEMLDPSVPDWPVEEALIYANLALQCAELRKKDRPDLGKVILPELNRLRGLAEDNTSLGGHSYGGSTGSSPSTNQSSSTSMDMLSDLQSGYDSSRSRSSTSSYGGKR
ncbi:U-box domain-containing protein 35 [Linum perenne]